MNWLGRLLTTAVFATALAFALWSLLKPAYKPNSEREPQKVQVVPPAAP